MKRLALVAAALCAAACTTPLDEGELLYRSGDRLGALETWRAVPESSSQYEAVRRRVGVVEAEFDRLVVQYKQRGRYYEAKQRLAESILNYRLALKLKPDDRETLAHVQQMARELASRKAELRRQHHAALEAGDLAVARERLTALREMDPFDPEIETDAREFRTALQSEVERRMEEGRLGFAAGDYAESTEAFRSVLELQPDNESARGYLSYIATLRAEAARSDGSRKRTKFASTQQIRAEGFYQNALAAEHREAFYDAIQNDLRALDADGSHSGAKRHLARLRRRLAPEVPELIERGRTAFRAEDLQSALDHWRRAQLVEPDNERVSAYIARAQKQLQNLERLRSEPDPGTGGT